MPTAYIAAVCDDNQNVILYDIFIYGDWHGSRRTLEQCTRYIRGVLFPTMRGASKSGTPKL